MSPSHHHENLVERIRFLTLTDGAFSNKFKKFCAKECSAVSCYYNLIDNLILAIII